MDPETIVGGDPSGRFERTNILLGRGAYKEVYKAYDLEEGVEVAWNQLLIDQFTKKDTDQILSEIRILQSLRNENIINFFHCWASRDADGKDRIYFITEMMTSGTLSSYIKRTKGSIKLKVIKQWCQQILCGLDYLHSRRPPIIHRDLKCENIFVNGNNGQIKIGDLGLATFKFGDHMTSVIGTPHFMAPELYDEKYNEKVDIYAFGMCVLELVTKEYPYSECTNPAQIFRKVTQSIKPLAVQNVSDVETRNFIELCIDFDPARRPTAAELVRHPFLLNRSISNLESNLSVEQMMSVTSDSMETFEAPKTKTLNHRRSASLPAISNDLSFAVSLLGSSESMIDMRVLPNLDKTPPPTRIVERDNNSSFCAIEILPLEGTKKTHQVTVKMSYAKLNEFGERAPNMHEIKFPFHLKNDTAENVVMEMIRENIIFKSDQALAKEKIEHAVKMANEMLLDEDEPSSPAVNTPIVVHLYRPRSLSTNNSPQAKRRAATSHFRSSSFQVKPRDIDDDRPDEEIPKVVLRRPTLSRSPSLSRKRPSTIHHIQSLPDSAIPLKQETEVDLLADPSVTELEELYRTKMKVLSDEFQTKKKELLRDLRRRKQENSLKKESANSAEIARQIQELKSKALSDFEMEVIKRKSSSDSSSIITNSEHIDRLVAEMESIPNSSYEATIQSEPVTQSEAAAFCIPDDWMAAQDDKSLTLHEIERSSSVPLTAYNTQDPNRGNRGSVPKTSEVLSELATSKNFK